MSKQKKIMEEVSILKNKMKIREVEAKKREEIVQFISTEVEVDFGTWFHSKVSKLPPGHLKEIIWADFKARGLKEKELACKYDEALKLYGIK